MAALWIMQVFLLNNFYGAMKSEQTEKVVSEIETDFRHHGSDRFLMDVDKISDSYDMYIYVVSFDGKTTYFSPSGNNHAIAPGINSESGTSVLYSSQLRELTEEMIQNNGSANMTFKRESDSQEILAFANVLKAKGKEDMITYVFSPLWPVSSTIEILKHQLIIVTIISLIVACLISFYLSFRITRPLRKMQKSAGRLASGEYGIVFPDGHYTELSNLSDTLTGASIELEKSDLMQKDLVANVSHDLRTPLTMIKSYAEMIRDISGDKPEKREEHLQVIIDESDRLNNLVEDLLTVSRIQSGKITLNRRTFNLTDTAESIINAYRGMENRYDSNGDGEKTDDDRQYHIEFKCKGSFNVFADEDKIKQVISNFISNAIKFCGNDGRVTVSIKQQGRAVRLSVADNGIGIAAKDLDHVWDRYYRASSNTVRETGGTGLGLAICKEILTLHKAEFGVDSKPGQGSTFWFQLGVVRKQHGKTQHGEW